MGGLWGWRLCFSQQFSLSVCALFGFIRPVAAEIEWESLISETRRLTMSGVLGLIETNLLFAEPGTQQPEIWRIAQSLLGLGAIRVLSRVCQAPCFEFLHQMYGVIPPESVEAREFWLRQESWTEISALNMSQEDSSYHRINQGAGPQIKVLWNSQQAEDERLWWQDTPRQLSYSKPAADRKQSASTAIVAERKMSEASSKLFLDPNGTIETMPEGNPRLSHVPSMVSFTSQNSSGIQLSRIGSNVAEGTTDKWWMDRWQTEIIAVAAMHRISIGQASHLLTVTYFGHAISPTLHILLGAMTTLLAVGSMITALLTDWAWIPQFAALTSLGYFVNRTASLRAWKFESSAPLRDECPSILEEWPSVSQVADSGLQSDKVLVRIAVQSSALCHLKGLFSFSRENMDAARDVARNTKARYKTTRHIIRSFRSPYTAVPGDSQVDATLQWLSFEAQSSFYGLVGSVVPDYVPLRSWSVIAVLANGIFLLIIGFGATVHHSWSGSVLGIYFAGILAAIAARSRGASWTMPEFDSIDLTVMKVPTTIRERIWELPGAEALKEIYRTAPKRHRLRSFYFKQSKTGENPRDNVHDRNRVA